MPTWSPIFQEHLPDDPNIIFLDNLRCQRMEEYISKIHDTNGSDGFGPENLTHAWAPIDRGHIGATLKQLAKQSFDDWLDQDSVAFPGVKNGTRWEQNKMTAKEKRVMCTWVYGEAWETLQKSIHRALRHRAWTSTGLMMTMIGVNDHCAIMEGDITPFEMIPPGEEFTDDDYVKKTFSKQPDFLLNQPLLRMRLGLFWHVQVRLFLEVWATMKAKQETDFLW